MNRIGIALAVPTLLALAQEAPIRKEGAYWVQVLTGSIAAPPNCKLRIENRGPITVQGQAASDRISYSIKKRVRATSESEARALLQAATIRVVSRGAAASVVLAQRRPLVLAEMQIATRMDLSLAAMESTGGDIQVYDIAGMVEAETAGGFIRIDRIGKDVSARTGGGEIHLGSVGGTLRCYSGGGNIQVGHAARESWLETAGGNIVVHRSGGPLHTSTAGGNIHVDRAGALVSARTAGGRIEVQQASGIVLADNSGGSIHVGSAPGVRLASAGGSIRLRGASGALRAATDVGSILAELASGVRLQDSMFSTGAGDITVYIPSKLALTVKALNESGPGGRIVSEFVEIPVRHAIAEAARQQVQAEGELNGGGPVLRLTSASGTIYLKRQR
jgi:DUF4097 and DUF4098 domain-containing protein YvlB